MVKISQIKDKYLIAGFTRFPWPDLPLAVYNTIQTLRSDRNDETAQQPKYLHHNNRWNDDGC